MINKTLQYILHAIPVLCMVSSSAFQSCSSQNENVYPDLEEIKAFHREDKYFKSSLVSLHFIIETSDIPKVDTIFSQIFNGYKLPVNPKGMPDGLYTGESPYDAFDFRHVVKIKIEDETIASVDYDEIHISGWGKQENEEYCREMSNSGTTPAIAYPVLENQLIDKQDIMDVDAISGATYSLYRFRYAVAVALMKAGLQVPAN